MRKLLMLAALAVTCFALAPAAGAATLISGPVNMTADTNGDNEVDVAINPMNAKNLVSAWNDYGSNSCGIGTSVNGGKTWSIDYLHGIDFTTYDYGAGDPSVGFLKNGTAVITCNAWSVSKPTALYTSYSTDGGFTWAPLNKVASEGNIGKNLDHPMLTIDKYGDRVLLAYSVWNGSYVANSYALVSSDDGRTYQGPYRIAADYKANSVDVFDASLAGAPDGTIYATTGIWQYVNDWNEQAVVVSQLRPGETAFTRSVKVRDLTPAPYTLPGEQWRTSMQASIGVERNGSVDLLTGDFVTGALDLYLARSTNHGLTFPSQVDLTNFPVGRDAVMPWTSVTPSGRIDTIYYDYREASGTMSAVYGQVAPGGASFSSTLVLQSGIDGDAQPPRGAGHTPFWGDYIGIDSTDRLVALTWTCNGPQSQDVCAATVKP
jgi:hypothetical protein